MNDILETVQHKIDKLAERLPGVMEWDPNPPGVVVDFKNGDTWYWYESEDYDYRWELLAELTAELMYWLDMQEMLLETV
jgi:hypothetical protein